MCHSPNWPGNLKAPVGAQIGSIADIAQIRAAGDLPRIQNVSARTLLVAIAQMPCFVLTALDVDLRDDRPVLRAQVARPDFAVAEPVSGVVPTRVQAVGVIVFYSLAFYRRRHGPGRQAPPSMRAQTPPRSHGLHSISFFDPPVPCLIVYPQPPKISDDDAPTCPLRMSPAHGRRPAEAHRLYFSDIKKQACNSTRQTRRRTGIRFRICWVRTRGFPTVAQQRPSASLPDGKPSSVIVVQQVLWTRPISMPQRIQGREAGRCTRLRDGIGKRLARLPPQIDKACSAPLPGASLPGTSYPSKPRTFTQETTFENLAQL